MAPNSLLCCWLALRNVSSVKVYPGFKILLVFSAILYQVKRHGKLHQRDECAPLVTLHCRTTNTELCLNLSQLSSYRGAPEGVWMAQS